MRRLLLVPFFATLLAAQAAPELVVSVGHAGYASHAAFAGGYLATATWSDVALIDISSGLTVAHLPQGSIILSMEASPDGEILAVGSCGSAIQLWNVRTRLLVRRIPLAQECADTLAFSPDGTLLAVDFAGCCSSKRRGLQVWDVRNGSLVREIETRDTVERVTFSGDGRWIVGVERGGTATVREWPSGRELRAFSGLDDPGYTGSAAIASRDGRYFAWIGGGGLRAFDVGSGSEVALPGARRVDIWDRPPRGPERKWSEEKVLATTAAFLEDGRLAYIDGNRMIVRQLASGVQQTFELGWPDAGISDIVITPMWLRIRRDGALVAGGGDSGTVLWDIGTARFRALTSPALTSPGSLRWSRTGLVAWTEVAAGVRIWDDRLARPSRVGRFLDLGENLAFRPDGERLAVTGSSAHIVNLASRRVIASRELSFASETGVAFSPDGSRVVFASTDGFGIFDGNLRPVRHLSSLEPYTDVEHAAFSPDGRWIAAGLGGPNPALRVWPAAGGAGERTLDTERVTYGSQPPAFSSDSRWLASS